MVDLYIGKIVMVVITEVSDLWLAVDKSTSVFQGLFFLRLSVYER